MDKRKSILNVSVSVILKVLLVLGGIFVRRAVIQHLGNGINGLNSLYLNIIDVLSLAELGIGEAVTYCMYAPVARGDKEKVSALYHLFKRLYLGVSAVIFAAGLAVLPFLKHIAVEYQALNVELESSFILMLLSVCMTYFYGADSALLNAHRNNYIPNAVTSGGKLLQYLLQIGVMVVTGSYTGFLVCRLICAGAQWLVTRRIVRKRYGNILASRAGVDPQLKATILKNAKAMLLHKIGDVAVNSTDSILISMFTGVVILGKYSNYLAIMTSMTGILGMVFSSLTSSVGHLYVQKPAAEVRQYFDRFHSINFMLGSLFFLGYYSVIHPLAGLLFGEDLLLDRHVCMILTLDHFIRFTRRSVLLFRDATGTFYHDRWKPVLESTVNLAVSILLGRSMGISGVLLGTVITNLLICDVVEPLVLYRNVFHAPVGGFYLKHYGFIFLFAAALLALDGILPEGGGIILGGFLSLPVSGAVCLIIWIASRKRSVNHEKYYE